MKKMKIIKIFVPFIIVVMLLTSCSIDVTINKGESRNKTEVASDTTIAETTDEWIDDDDSDITPVVTSRQDLANTEALTEAAPAASTVSDWSRRIPDGAKEISAKKALKMYAKYFGDVKAEGYGFTKTEWANIDNINMPADPTGIVNNILTVVGKNVIKNTKADALNGAVTVAPGSAQITSEFPVYGKEYVFSAENTDFIKEAYVVKGEETVDYYVLFNDVLNPDAGADGFGNIMTPFDRNAILEAIKQYVPVADLTSLKLDCTYSGSYMIFRISRKDKTPVSLEQNHFALVDAKAELNLIIISTNCLNGTFDLEIHDSYTDFTK